MDANWFPGFVTGSLAIIAVIVTGWLQSRRERRNAEHTAKAEREKHKETSQTPTPPSTVEVWARLDRIERVLSSTVVLLSEAAEQWPKGSSPVFSRKHVAIVSEAGYMPPEWDPIVDDS